MRRFFLKRQDMKRNTYSALFLILFTVMPVGIVTAQENAPLVYDENYREDQFYLGSTYNLWNKKADGIAQRNFSYGVMGGFIRDMPLNKLRTFAVGLGVGFSFNNYYSNLRAVKDPSGIAYIIPEAGIDYKRNKLVTNTLELPFEFRWRNSTPSDFSFWRLYTGFKLGYTLGARSKYVTSSFSESFSNNDIRQWQYGLTLSAGYNALTLHVYYGLNSFFDNRVYLAESELLSIRPLRFGLIFYIL